MPAKKTSKKVENQKEENAVPQKDCEHCEGTGKCTAGEPYDPSHHQSITPQVRLTSCQDCLEAAGEHRNSKKLVACRICGGTGKVAE
jgi:hypothetical protein